MQSAIRDLNCPVPSTGNGDRVLLAHGEGGRLMRQLIERRILPTFENEFLQLAGDAAILPKVSGQLAMTTDSFVVTPLFFPGGDIGSLAVYGTVNDLVVAGATPRWITLALILEEGLEIEVLDRVLRSVAAAAKQVGIPVVAGDTKVVPRGAADKLFINTTGIGEIVGEAPVVPGGLQVGDEIIVTGAIGRHGIAVMAAREQLAFDPPPESDSAPLVDAVLALHRARVSIRAMRDATRGGVAAVLHEWAAASHLTLTIREHQIPVNPEVRGACEVLGLDPIHVANEGTMVLAVPAGESAKVVELLRTIPETCGAACIGRVDKRGIASVVIERAVGRRIPIDEPSGAPLPRIC